MPSYVYLKAEPAPPSKFREAKKRTTRRLARMLPNILIVLGATTVTTVAYPMISFQLTHSNNQTLAVVSPVNDIDMKTMKIDADKNPKMLADNAEIPVQAFQDNKIEPIIVDIDYTKASNWFPEAMTKKEFNSDEIATSYNLSIPKLNIDKMNVEIGGENLDKSLIQYGGTALPGQPGNPVIFGHSVLPIFNNPKSYMSVFTKLPTLKDDDEIFIDYDGIRYKYVVESYHEVQPEDIEVLEQRYDRQTVTLITCVPPGTYLRRGVIQAHLVK